MITATNRTTGNKYNFKTIEHFVWETAKEEDIISFFNECYGAVRIPLIGRVNAGRAAWFLGSEHSRQCMEDEYCTWVAETLNEVLGHCNTTWKDYHLSKSCPGGYIELGKFYS